MTFVRSSLAALAATSIFTSANAAYSLTDNYEPSKFFSMFSFFTAADPTHGYVQYVSESQAQSQDLIKTSSNSVYMGVDMNKTATGSGRESVRLSSSKTYQTGLFVLDASHMPTGCGTWPAFWLVGPNWPNDGEIDIIEGVNLASTDQATLHTSSGCSITSGKQMSGKMGSTSCASSNGNNQGCDITTSNTNSYGAGFNSAQGGVYATEVTSSEITVWFFPRSSVPSDLTSGSPNPSGWSEPLAVFSGCNIAQHFQDMQIVFDTTFCGDWAGQVWSSDSQCSSKASSCQAYVQNNPQGFEQAYWTVNSLKVYSGSSSGGSSSNSTGSGSASTPAGSAPTASRTHASSAGGAGGASATGGAGQSTLQTSAATASAATSAAASEAPTSAASAAPSGPPSGAPSYASSWGAWGGHGGRGRPTGTPGSPGSKHRRHAAIHAQREAQMGDEVLEVAAE